MKGPAAGKTGNGGTNVQSRMEAGIVDALQRYFRDDKGKMGKQELSILDSVMRYFEDPAVNTTPVRR